MAGLSARAVSTFDDFAKYASEISTNANNTEPTPRKYRSTGMVHSEGSVLISGIACLRS
jgi:hypothetical protein